MKLINKNTGIKPTSPFKGHFSEMQSITLMVGCMEGMASMMGDDTTFVSILILTGILPLSIGWIAAFETYKEKISRNPNDYLEYIIKKNIWNYVFKNKKYVHNMDMIKVSSRTINRYYKKRGIRTNSSSYQYLTSAEEYIKLIGTLKEKKGFPTMRYTSIYIYKNRLYDFTKEEL